ncbi:vWA domain-containing protein [Bradyrhizobium cenepequi]
MSLKMEACALTPAQEKLWSDTRVSLLWNCPAFSHIFYTMLDNAGSKHVALFTKEVPIAATDGINLLLNPDTFFKYNLQERIFICAHEIMHCVWNHCGLMHDFIRRGKVAYPDGSNLPYDAETMNIATDLVINDMLIESKVGLFNKDWMHDKALGVANDSAIDVYKKVFKSNPPGKGGSGSGPAGARFDQHLPPGKSTGQDPAKAQQGRSEAEWKTNVAAAASAAKAMGKLPAGLERLLGEILNPQVDWREHIQSLMARKLGSGSYDWQSPDKRMIVRDIYTPGRSGYGAGTVVVGADTSGSIGKKELDMFFAEIAGILEDIRPRRLVIMWCDAKVDQVDECEEPGDLNEIRAKPVPGGGGTSFIPVFDEIEKLGIIPEALVYLTDGFGSFPSKPPQYSVIWGSITPKDGVTYPFGDVVLVPKQAA